MQKKLESAASFLKDINKRRCAAIICHQESAGSFALFSNDMSEEDRKLLEEAAQAIHGLPQCNGLSSNTKDFRTESGERASIFSIKNKTTKLTVMAKGERQFFFEYVLALIFVTGVMDRDHVYFFLHDEGLNGATFREYCLFLAGVPL